MRASTVGLAILNPLRWRIGSTAPSRAGLRNLLECQLVASGAGFRLAVADDAGNDQIGIVESGAIGVGQRIAQLAAFMNRARRFRRHMAGNAVGPGELAKQPLQSVALRSIAG